MIPYTVKSGDTLSHIAKKYKITLKQLLEANKERFPDRRSMNSIKTGEKINIPDNISNPKGFNIYDDNISSYINVDPTKSVLDKELSGSGMYVDETPSLRLSTVPYQFQNEAYLRDVLNTHMTAGLAGNYHGTRDLYTMHSKLFPDKITMYGPNDRVTYIDMKYDNLENPWYNDAVKHVINAMAIKSHIPVLDVMNYLHGHRLWLAISPDDTWTVSDTGETVEMDSDAPPAGERVVVYGHNPRYSLKKQLLTTPKEDIVKQALLSTQLQLTGLTNPATQFGRAMYLEGPSVNNYYISNQVHSGEQGLSAAIAWALDHMPPNHPFYLKYVIDGEPIDTSFDVFEAMDNDKRLRDVGGFKNFYINKKGELDLIKKLKVKRRK